MWHESHVQQEERDMNWAMPPGSPWIQRIVPEVIPLLWDNSFLLLPDICVAVVQFQSTNPAHDVDMEDSYYCIYLFFKVWEIIYKKTYIKDILLRLENHGLEIWCEVLFLSPCIHNNSVLMIWSCIIYSTGHPSYSVQSRLARGKNYNCNKNSSSVFYKIYNCICSQDNYFYFLARVKMQCPELIAVLQPVNTLIFLLPYPPAYNILWETAGGEILYQSVSCKYTKSII